MTSRIALAALLAVAAPAAALDVQGVDVPESIVVDGAVLHHNGSGVRKKLIVKVYVGSLYLPRRATTADELLARDEPWGVRLVFLRDVSRGQMLDAFRDGFANNSPSAAQSLAPRLDELARALPDEMRERSTLAITYLPGKGSVVAAQGGKEVVVEGKDFADALLRNWLGAKPADDGLKRRMLGG